jgi:hypothetical protein
MEAKDDHIFHYYDPMNKIIIVPVSLILRIEHKLRMFEIEVPRKMFG